MIVPLLLLGSCAAAAGRSLADRVESDYVEPALAAVQDAAQGRASSWTPPALAEPAFARDFESGIDRRWIAPLADRGQADALSAARALASSDPAAAASLDGWPSWMTAAADSPAARALSSWIDERALARVFSPDYILGAARALGLGAPAPSPPPAPDLSGLVSAPAASAPAARRPGADAWSRSRRVRDSTGLVRAGSASFAAPRLKPAPEFGSGAAPSFDSSAQSGP